MLIIFRHNKFIWKQLISIHDAFIRPLKPIKSKKTEEHHLKKMIHFELDNSNSMSIDTIH